jgi:hypothetical protein
MVGGPAAWGLQLPARLLLSWVDAVSATAGRIPLGELHRTHLGAIAVGVAVVAAARRRGRVGMARVAWAGVALAVLSPALVLQRASVDGVEVAPGTQLWLDGGAAVVVVDGQARPIETLAALRRIGVRHVDLLVTRRGGTAASELVRAIDDRYVVGLAWAPLDHRVRGAAVPPRGAVARAGPFAVTVTTNAPRLDVAVSRIAR